MILSYNDRSNTYVILLSYSTLISNGNEGITTALNTIIQNKSVQPMENHGIGFFSYKHLTINSMFAH